MKKSINIIQKQIDIFRKKNVDLVLIKMEIEKLYDQNEEGFMNSKKECELIELVNNLAEEIDPPYEWIGENNKKIRILNNKIKEIFNQYDNIQSNIEKFKIKYDDDDEFYRLESNLEEIKKDLDFYDKNMNTYSFENIDIKFYLEQENKLFKKFLEGKLNEKQYNEMMEIDKIIQENI